MFLLYNIINCRQSGLKYFLLIKTQFWEQTYANVDALTIAKLNETAEKIKTIEKSINPTIWKLERDVQIVAVQTSHLFARCIDEAFYIKALMISNEMPVL